MRYDDVYKYWNENPCTGGNSKFPYWMFTHEKVLEIGCGTGEDAQGFIRHGAIYTGIDLTHKAILSAKAKIGSQGRLEVMNAEYMDFPDNYFNLVYSWGVIHHALNPKNIINEAYRVAKPGGSLIMMLYNKPSFRYFDIMVLRKILWHLHYYKYNKLRKITPNPTDEQWISWNTDNLGCPLSRVYTKQEAIDLLGKFELSKTWTENNEWFRIVIGKK